MNFKNKQVNKRYKYGIKPRKTYDYDFSIPDIDKAFYIDYLRGYFDGNCTIGKTTKYYVGHINGGQKLLRSFLSTVYYSNTCL